MKFFVTLLFLTSFGFMAFSQDTMPPKDLRLAATMPLPEIQQAADFAKFEKIQKVSTWAYGLGLVAASLHFFTNVDDSDNLLITSGILLSAGFVIDASSYFFIED